MALSHEQVADPNPGFIRLPEVLKRVGIGKSRIYVLMGEGAFPKPVKLGRMSLWRDDAITEWVEHQSTSH